MALIKPTIAPHRHPISKRFSKRGRIVTFAKDEHSENPTDMAFLNSIKKCFCAYGAADCRIYPFICSIGRFKRLPTARQVLEALGASSFKSEHIADLDVPTIPYPGYHPGTANDEIHTDRSGQAIFSKRKDGGYTDELHHALRERVVNKHLYYVLLHDAPERYGDYWFSEWVVLFAVGISKASGNLMAILTHQVCHNYCD